MWIPKEVGVRRSAAETNIRTYSVVRPSVLLWEAVGASGKPVVDNLGKRQWVGGEEGEGGGERAEGGPWERDSGWEERRERGGRERREGLGKETVGGRRGGREGGESGGRALGKRQWVGGEEGERGERAEGGPWERDSGWEERRERGGRRGGRA